MIILINNNIITTIDTDSITTLLPAAALLKINVYSTINQLCHPMVLLLLGGNIVFVFVEEGSDSV